MSWSGLTARASPVVETGLLLVGLSLVACKPLPPDPVIREGVDLGPIQSFEVERIPGASGIGSVSDPAAGDTHALEFYSNATGSLNIELLTDVSGFVLRARGEECKGWPEVEVTVDGDLALRTEVKSRSWMDYPVMRPLAEGSHRFDFRFTNDRYDPPCDRNLLLDKVTFVNAGAVSRGTLAAVSMILPSGITIEDDDKASEGKAAAFMSSATATGLWRLERPASALIVRARADSCEGPPQLTIGIDQLPKVTLDVPASTWTDYRVPRDPRSGRALNRRRVSE